MSARIRWTLAVFALVTFSTHNTAPVSAQVAAAVATANPPAAFNDPNRRARLATAFPEIDKVVAEFMTRSHVPGAAWA